MQDKPVVIITYSKDFTADHVVHRLNNEGRCYIRINTDKHNSFPISLNYEENEVTLHLNCKRTYPCGIWFRRVYKSNSSSFEESYSDAEAFNFFMNIGDVIGCNIISLPSAIHKTENKMYQLKIARNIGFTIPKTIIANYNQDVGDFFSNHDKLVVKPLSVPYFDFDGKEYKIYSNSISKIDLTEHNSHPCFSIFQEKINKKYELRVTVIGNKAFFSKTTPKGCANGIDWRLEDVEYDIYEPTSSLLNKCLMLVKAFNLKFAAIDIAVDDKDNFFFLEANPNGQWAWLEHELNLPLSETLISELYGQQNL